MALIIGMIGAAWVYGAPALEQHYLERGKTVPRWLRLAATSARGVQRKAAAIVLRHRFRQAIKRIDKLDPIHVRKVDRTPSGWRMEVTFSAGQHAGHADKYAASIASILQARDSPPRRNSAQLGWETVGRIVARAEGSCDRWASMTGSTPAGSRSERKNSISVRNR